MKSRVKQIAKKTVAIVDNNIVLAIAILHETELPKILSRVSRSGCNLHWSLMYTFEHGSIISYLWNVVFQLLSSTSVRCENAAA